MPQQLDGAQIDATMWKNPTTMLPCEISLDNMLM